MLVGFVKYLLPACMDFTVPQFTVSHSLCAASRDLLRFGWLLSDSVKCKGAPCVQGIECGAQNRQKSKPPAKPEVLPGPIRAYYWQASQGALNFISLAFSALQPVNWRFMFYLWLILLSRLLLVTRFARCLKLKLLRGAPTGRAGGFRIQQKTLCRVQYAAQGLHICKDISSRGIV